jgi:hypothetical protein
MNERTDAMKTTMTVTTLRGVALWAAVLGLAVSARAEDPRGSASATIAGKKVALDYGRPALKGRDLTELMTKLPPDRIWRAGENQVTTLTTDTDLLVGATKVPAGRYSVYVHAAEQGDWALVLNKDLGVPLGEIFDRAPEHMQKEPWPRLGTYEKVRDQEVARVPMKPAQMAEATELFTMSFAAKGEGAELTLAWGPKAWAVDVQPAR